MMYSHNLAAAIKVGGKILREFGDTVYLPFGSEYQVRLKNLSTSRTKVSIEIDGNSVTQSGLILDPFQTFDLERFIRNGNLKEGNRFKFIERTTKIEEHRGVKLEDGLITIHYEFEISQPFHMALQSSNCESSRLIAKYCATSALSGDRGSINSMPIANNTGITVEGSKSNQSFSTTHWRGSSGGTFSMTIRLLGETVDNKAVCEPVTVRTKFKCKTCGTLNKSTANFCSECGTALQILS